MRRWRAPHLYLTNGDSPVHCAGLLLHFRIILSGHTVSQMENLAGTSMTGRQCDNCKWRCGESGGGCINTSVYPPELAYGAGRNSLRAFG